MKPGKIRHRRLYAFFESKVLNVLMLIVEICLMAMACTQSMLLPTICGTAALMSFLGYAIWFWVRKPQQIIIDKCLSGINGWFTLYFLIVMAMDAPNRWWYIMPISIAICVVIVCLLRKQGKCFDITEART